MTFGHLIKQFQLIKTVQAKSYSAIAINPI